MTKYFDKCGVTTWYCERVLKNLSHKMKEEKISYLYIY